MEILVIFKWYYGSPPFGTDKLLLFSDRLLYDIFQYAIAKLKALHGEKTTIHPIHEGVLIEDNLCHRASVLVHHFESKIKRRTYISFSRYTPENFSGGCVFINWTLT